MLVVMSEYGSEVGGGGNSRNGGELKEWDRGKGGSEGSSEAGVGNECNG